MNIPRFHEPVGMFSSRHDIFGWIQVLYSPRPIDRMWRGLLARDDMERGEIAALVGAEYHELLPIFSIRRWPEEIRDLYLIAEAGGDQSGMAEAGAQAINWFIADRICLPRYLRLRVRPLEGLR